MSKRRRPAAARKVAEARFWGTAEPEVRPHAIRPTTDAAALVRSLGLPPLAGDAAVVERHLRAVYEEAVRTATAVAAAGGLLASDDDPD